MPDVPPGSPSGPPDPFPNPLQTGAAQLHETFTTLVGAGFNEKQALTIIAIALANGQSNEQQ
jgi:hypothetical protein